MEMLGLIHARFDGNYEFGHDIKRISLTFSFEGHSFSCSANINQDLRKRRLVHSSVISCFWNNKIFVSVSSILYAMDAHYVQYLHLGRLLLAGTGHHSSFPAIMVTGIAQIL